MRRGGGLLPFLEKGSVCPQQQSSTALPEPPIQRRPRKTFDWSTAFIAVVVIAAAATVYWRDGKARFLEILYADVWLFIDILPKVLAACLIASSGQLNGSPRT